MASIFNINKWENGKDYKVDDIVTHVINNVSYYFYAINDSRGEAPTIGVGGFWVGVLSPPPANMVKPHFLWTPSYSNSSSSNPKIKSMRFGNGYEQRIKDGFYNDLLIFNANFSDRTEKEATAIIHFLASREGVESFYYTPPAPYGILKKFICRGYNSTLKFLNNYDITVTLEEVP